MFDNWRQGPGIHDAAFSLTKGLPAQEPGGGAQQAPALQPFPQPPTDEVEDQRRRRQMLADMLQPPSMTPPGSHFYFTPEQGARLGMAIGRAFGGGIFGGTTAAFPDYGGGAASGSTPGGGST